MQSEHRTARVLVGRQEGSSQVVARAALELTSSCYVWLERDGDGLVVTLTEREPLGEDLEARFAEELARLAQQDRLERHTRLIRSAIVGRALGPAPRRRPQPPSGSILDPETEAEIERLLAEIENDDWLDDASEIAKTWEERFGVDPECKEES